MPRTHVPLRTRAAAAWLALLLGASGLGWAEGTFWTYEAMGGGLILGNGDVKMRVEGVRDRHSGLFSGVLVLDAVSPVTSLEDARLDLVHMDELTYDFVHEPVAAHVHVADDGRRAVWLVAGHAVPTGRRLRGVRLTIPSPDGGSPLLLETAYGGPSWAENERVAAICERLVAMGEAGVTRGIALLDARDPIERAAAIFALGLLGRRAEEVVAILLLHVETERHAWALENAAHTLGRLGADAAPAVPLLRGWANDPSTRPLLRMAAIRALGNVGPSAADAVPDLVQLVRTDAGTLRFFAVRALGQIGAPAAPARPVLEDAQERTRDAHTLAAITEALARIP